MHYETLVAVPWVLGKFPLRVKQSAVQLAKSKYRPLWVGHGFQLVYQNTAPGSVHGTVSLSVKPDYVTASLIVTAL